MRYILGNENIVIEFNQLGKPVLLQNKNYQGVNYLREYDLWRLIIEDEQCLEVEVIPGLSLPAIATGSNELKIIFSDVIEKKSKKKLNIIVEVSIQIKQPDTDIFSFSINIINNQHDALVKESHFPLLAINEEAITGVITTYTGGQYFKDVKRKILQGHTQFKGIDHHYVRDVNCYPNNAMNCMVIDHDFEGLYYGCHDNEFNITGHALELDSERNFNMLMVRFPNISANEKYCCEDFVISPYKGDWKTAAQKYRNWADAWFITEKRPEYLNETQGWQRIIMRTQCGEMLFGYNDLQAPFDAAKKAGIDTLFLFGWHQHGMDNGYPDYSYDNSQGGFNKLKDSIEKIQKQGGKIILYFNGQLIDSRSDFFKDHAGEVSTKVTNGDMEKHCYQFPAYGITALKFGNRSFTTACPSSQRWLEILKSCIDQAVSLGVDAVFFDQIGSMAYPCYDKNHGHPTPYISIQKSRNNQLQQLRSYLKSKSPNMALGVEWLSDVTSRFVDFVHIWGNTAEIEIPATPNKKADYISFQEFFHYAFPEVLFSNREIRDDVNIPARVNAMLLKGCCSDVEVYRCQDSIDKTPIYQRYLGLANNLRRKYADILFHGYFLANAHQACFSNNELYTASWKNDDILAIMVCQSHCEKLIATINLDGFEFISFDSVRGDVAVYNNLKSQNIVLLKDSLAVLKYKSI